jgi:hypothetical protein
MYKKNTLKLHNFYHSKVEKIRLGTTIKKDISPFTKVTNNKMSELFSYVSKISILLRSLKKDIKLKLGNINNPLKMMQTKFTVYITDILQQWKKAEIFFIDFVEILARNSNNSFKKMKREISTNKISFAQSKIKFNNEGISKVKEAGGSRTTVNNYTTNNNQTYNIKVNGSSQAASIVQDLKNMQQLSMIGN